MITGEERLREHLVDLYGEVVGYEGKPSQIQLDRTESLGKEMNDVATDFDTWCNTELTDLKEALKQKSLDPVEPLTRDSWDKQIKK